MADNLKTVLPDPPQEALKSFTKSQLLEASKHYNLSVKKYMLKSEIINILLNYMVDEEIIPADFDLLETVNIDALRIKELEYQFKMR